MAGLTSAQLVSEIEVLIELSGTDVDTSVLRYLNICGRDLWISHPWRARRKEVIITTVGTYGDGTVTVTNGSATVTGASTTFTSAMEGRKFCLSPGGPTYRILTWVSATQITLARNYQEANASGSSYTIYQDEYDVATDVDLLRDSELLWTRFRGRLPIKTQTELDHSTYNTSSIATPRVVAPCTPTTAGTFRIRVWPIPDTVYGIRVLYFRTWTEITAADSTLHSLGADKDRLLILATCIMAQKIPGTTQVTTEAEVHALTERSWQDEQDTQPLVGVRKPFDQYDVYTNDIQIDTTSF